MRLDPNKLYYKMVLNFQRAISQKNKLIICNEGGTRAGKTFDTFDLITTICDHNRNKGLDIYILRDTLVRCRDYTLNDWKKLCKINQIQYSGKETPKPKFNLFGNNIYFRGLDDPDSEGYPSDILFFNEVLEMDKQQVDDLLMRCRLLAVFDWNPKLTKHWIFDWEGRADVLWTNTTYKDNKHLEKSIVDEIESYNPEIEANIINKTANLFRWKVYGLGERADQEGNVFNDSKLSKFDLKDIDIKNNPVISWVDVADQGIDWFCQLFACIVDKKVYIFDVIFTPKGADYTIPLIYEKFKKHNVSIAYFESNAMGLSYTREVIKHIRMIECMEQNIVLTPKYRSKWEKVIKARPAPTGTSKHSRIVIQAETNIIPNFFFLNHRTGMYAEYYDYLTSYKHDKSFKQDDAPDATAGLSILSQKYI